MKDGPIPAARLRAPEPFAVEIDADRVIVRGELDLATMPELERSLRGLAGDVTLDCRQLAFIDSFGAVALERTHERYAAENRRLCIQGLAPQCERVFTVLGLDQSMHLA